MQRLERLFQCGFLFVFLMIPSAFAQEFQDYKGLWVSRFDYRNGSASTVRNIVDNAASMGITDLLFQVRGHGDAYYNSSVEPRSNTLSGTWDPLQVAIDRAQTHGMKLHAWINTMPLWSGTISAAGRYDSACAPFYNSRIPVIESRI